MCKNPKISETRPEPKNQGLLGFGLDNPESGFLIPNPTRSTINIITMGSYLRWLSIYIFLLQTIHKMGFDAIERLQIVIKNYTNFSYRGICLPQCRTHTDCLKDQDCAEDGRCLHFCSWRQRKEKCRNKTICDLYENSCLKPCKGQFLKSVLIYQFGFQLSNTANMKILLPF